MKFKKSYQLFGFPAEYSTNKCLKLAKEAGFEAVEVNLVENGEITLETDKNKFLKIKEYADSKNMKISGIASTLYWANPINSDIKERADKADEIVKKMIEAARYLGCDTILLVPGVVHTDLKELVPNPERMSYDRVHAKSLEKIKEYGNICSNYNITIAIENVFWNKFLLSPFDFINFVDSVNLENVKIYFDVGNCLMCGLPEHWIKMFGKKRLHALHLKDLDTVIANFSGFKSLLDGDVKWDEVYKSLVEIDYEGYITYEGFGSYNYFPEEQAYNASRAIDKIFKLK